MDWIDALVTSTEPDMPLIKLDHDDPASQKDEFLFMACDGLFAVFSCHAVPVEIS